MQPKQPIQRDITSKISKVGITSLGIGVLAFCAPWLQQFRNAEFFFVAGFGFFVIGLILLLLGVVKDTTQHSVTKYSRIMARISIIFLFVVPLIGLIISAQNSQMVGLDGIGLFMLFIAISPFGWAVVVAFIISAVLNHSARREQNPNKSTKLMNVSQIIFLITSGLVGGFFFYLVTLPTTYESD